MLCAGEGAALVSVAAGRCPSPTCKYFATAEEAALCIARTPTGREACTGDEPHVTVVDGLAFVSRFSRR